VRSFEQPVEQVARARLAALLDDLVERLYPVGRFLRVDVGDLRREPVEDAHPEPPPTLPPGYSALVAPTALLPAVGGSEAPAGLMLPAAAAEAQPAESATPTPEVPAVYRVYKPASSGELHAAVELALSETVGELDRHLMLEQRRELWSDVSALQRLARSIT